MTIDLHLGGYAWRATCAHANALSEFSAFLGVRVVSPIKNPSTGEVRPQAICDRLMNPLFGDTKDGVRVRSLGPPI